MFEGNTLFEKIGIGIIFSIFIGAIGGRLFMALAKHLVLKYFDGLEKKMDLQAMKAEEKAAAAFLRIDELRSMWRDFINIEFRDYKRDVAIAIQENKDSTKELFERTDNHRHVAETVEFCNRRNKKGAGN